MNVFDITVIEESVKNLVVELGVSSMVYNNRPTATEKTADDFVVVEITGSIYDRATYGECTIGIHLFAKDVDNVKNQKKLSVMQSRLFSNFPAEKDNLIFSIAPTVMADLSDGMGYHSRIINIKTIIKIK